MSMNRGHVKRKVSLQAQVHWPKRTW